MPGLMVVDLAETDVEGSAAFDLDGFDCIDSDLLTIISWWVRRIIGWAEMQNYTARGLY